MKIGIHANVFNFKMREKRKQLGLSQYELAKSAGVYLDFVSSVERLLLPKCAIKARAWRNSFVNVSGKLQQIANALEMPFDELFPPDYLILLQDKILPVGRAPLVWAREVRLDALPPSHALLALPSPEEVVEREVITGVIQSEIRNVLETLGQKERLVLIARFGLDGQPPKTLEEVGALFGVSRVRIMQVEGKALRKLRHPKRSKRLRELL